MAGLHEAVFHAARHLDETEGPVHTGRVLQPADRSAINTVLNYLAGLNRQQLAADAALPAVELRIAADGGVELGKADSMHALGRLLASVARNMTHGEWLGIPDDLTGPHGELRRISLHISGPAPSEVPIGDLGRRAQLPALLTRVATDIAAGLFPPVLPPAPAYVGQFPPVPAAEPAADPARQPRRPPCVILDTGPRNGRSDVVVYAPFSDEESARQFAEVLTAEVDPAHVAWIADPVYELLSIAAHRQETSSDTGGRLQELAKAWCREHHHDHQPDSDGPAYDDAAHELWSILTGGATHDPSCLDRGGACNGRCRPLPGTTANPS